MNNYTIYLNKNQRCDNEVYYNCCYEDIWADYYTFEGIWICFYKKVTDGESIAEKDICVFRIRESVVEAIEEDGRG